MRGISLKEFNLLVGCPKDREQAAKSEIQYFIGDLLADANLIITVTRISGLITCRTSLDPFHVVHRLREFALENPYQFRFAVRFTPLEFCVKSNLATLAEIARQLLQRINEHETFRVTVRRRQTTLENMDVIKAIAEEIPRTVNLDDPDRTIWVEIVGEMTGISVLDEGTDILSITAMEKT